MDGTRHSPPPPQLQGQRGKVNLRQLTTEAQRAVSKQGSTGLLFNDCDLEKRPASPLLLPQSHSVLPALAPSLAQLRLGPNKTAVMNCGARAGSGRGCVIFSQLQRNFVELPSGPGRCWVRSRGAVRQTQKESCYALGFLRRRRSQQSARRVEYGMQSSRVIRVGKTSVGPPHFPSTEILGKRSSLPPLFWGVCNEHVPR